MMIAIALVKNGDYTPEIKNTYTTQNQNKQIAKSGCLFQGDKAYLSPRKVVFVFQFTDSFLNSL